MNDIKSSIEGVVNTIKDGVGDAGDKLKKAFDPKDAKQSDCPSNSYSNWVGDCVGHAVDREDGRNDGE